MFLWLKDVWGVVQDALGHRRYFLAPIIGTVIAAVDWLKPHLVEFKSMADLVGIPSLWVGVIVAIIIVMIQILNYAVELRRKIIPRIEIDFSPDAGSIMNTPVMIAGESSVQSVGEAIYIRGLVSTSFDIAIKDCSVYLTEVSSKSSIELPFSPTKFLDGLPLFWSSSGNQYSTRVIKGVRQYFDILIVNRVTGFPTLCGMTPYRLGDMFRQPGIYKLKVIVNADGASASATFQIKWGPNWNDISGEKLSSDKG